MELRSPSCNSRMGWVAMTRLAPPLPIPNARAHEFPIVEVRERGQVAVTVTQADRVALQEIKIRLGGRAFELVDLPNGTRLDAGPFIGLFSLPTFTLCVQPKEDVHPLNVLLMLQRASGRAVSLPPVSQELNLTDLQELLAALFLDALRAQMHRGLLRQPELVREDARTVRGRLRIPAYLRQADPTRLPVEYPDFTANHPVNRLFLLVLERLARRVQASASRRMVAELRVALHDAGVRPFTSTPANRHAFLLNRLQRRYDVPLRLAWLLLEGWGALPTRGNWLGEAFTFDMDRVFEKFMERVLIEDVLTGTPYRATAQGGGMRERFLFSGKKQELKPDLLIYEGDSVKLIVDFKNKRAGDQLGRDDLYQMYAYARHLHCSRVLLLYPGQAPLQDVTATRGEPLTITAASVNLSREFTPDLSQLHHHLRACLRTQGLTL